MEDQLCKLPTAQIIDPKTVLRLVNRHSVEYLELLDSIQEHGLLNSISVRPAGDRAPGLHEAVDGLYRLTCCRELGIESMPCIIKHGLSDLDVLALQIQANAIRPETTRIEFATQLKRIQRSHVGITLPEIAVMVKKHPAWVRHQLHLLNLDAEIQKLVDRGEIPIQSAYELAKFPVNNQKALLDQARVLPAREFKALAAAAIKRWSEQARQGRLDEHFGKESFEPQAYLRPLKHVLREIEQRAHAPVVLVAENARTPIDGFLLGLKWAASLDRQSVEEQRQAFERRGRQYVRLLLEQRASDQS